MSLAKRIANYDDPGSVASRLRLRRSESLREMISGTYAKCGRVDILDVGGTRNYWNMLPPGFLNENNAKITLLNIKSPKDARGDEVFSFAEGDGCDLGAFGAGRFHIAHSNSVLEHVGNWDRMERFAREIARVGQKYFVQTPNYWFPVEPHFMTPFLHWLPKPARVWLVLHFSLGHWDRAATVGKAVRAVEHASLVNRRMFAALFPDAEILTERLMLLPKSLIAVKR